MAVTQTPNLGLNKPAVGDDITALNIGELINANWDTIDSQLGGAVTPSRMNIDADLEFNGNAATELGKVRFSNQPATLSGGANILTLYTTGADGDIYFVDGQGRNIRISSAGALDITAAAGIGGDYAADGDALFSYVSATDTYKAMQDGAANQAGTVDTGPIKQRSTVAGASNYITLQVPAGLSASYALTWPDALPASASLLVVSAAGLMSTSRDLAIDTVATTGNATIGGVLDAASITPTGGTTAITGALTTTGNATVGGTLDADDITPTGGALAVTGDLSVSGILDADDITPTGGTLALTGTLDADEIAPTGGTLAVTGDLDVSGNVKHGEFERFIYAAEFNADPGSALALTSTTGWRSDNSSPGFIYAALPLNVGDRLVSLTLYFVEADAETATCQIYLGDYSTGGFTQKGGNKTTGTSGAFASVGWTSADTDIPLTLASGEGLHVHITMPVTSADQELRFYGAKVVWDRP